MTNLAHKFLFTFNNLDLNSAAIVDLYILEKSPVVNLLNIDVLPTETFPIKIILNSIISLFASPSSSSFFSELLSFISENRQRDGTD